MLGLEQWVEQYNQIIHVFQVLTISKLCKPILMTGDLPYFLWVKVR